MGNVVLLCVHEDPSSHLLPPPTSGPYNNHFQIGGLPPHSLEALTVRMLSQYTPGAIPLAQISSSGRAEKPHSGQRMAPSRAF